MGFPWNADQVLLVGDPKLRRFKLGVAKRRPDETSLLFFVSEQLMANLAGIFQVRAAYLVSKKHKAFNPPYWITHISQI